MKHIELFESFLNRPFAWSKDFQVQTFIEDWTAGETSALNILTPGVIKNMQSRLDKDKYVLYRGIVHSDKYMFEKEGVSWDKTKVGDMKKFKSKQPTSWTIDKNIAKNFANPAWDKLKDRPYSSKHMENTYSPDDLIGYGMVVRAVIDAKYIYADLSKFTEYLTRSFINKEHEFIVGPGIYEVKVMDKKIYAMGYNDYIYNDKIAQQIGDTRY